MKSIQAIVDAHETITVQTLTPVRDAARLMAERQIGAVPVLDGDRLAGIFTERDVMARIVAPGLDPSATPVRDVMSTDLVVASPKDDTDTCLRRMQQARVRHLVVLRDGRLAGIVSLRDLMAVEMNEKDDAITLLNAYVHDIPAHLPVRASNPI